MNLQTSLTCFWDWTLLELFLTMLICFNIIRTFFASRYSVGTGRLSTCYSQMELILIMSTQTVSTAQSQNRRSRSLCTHRGLFVLFEMFYIA